MKNMGTDEALKNELIDSGLKPFAEQMHSLEHIGRLWDSLETLPVNCSGAVLSGSQSCGKTFTAGALLWKRRLEGPQLLLCQTLSVVSRDTNLCSSL